MWEFLNFLELMSVCITPRVCVCICKGRESVFVVYECVCISEGVCLYV